MTILDFCRDQPAKTIPINLNSSSNNRSISKKMLYSQRILNQPSKKVTIRKTPTNIPTQPIYNGLKIPQAVNRSIFSYDSNNKIRYSTDIEYDQSLINRPQAFHTHNR